MADEDYSDDAPDEGIPSDEPEVEGSEEEDGDEQKLKKQLLDTKRKLSQMGEENATMRGKLSALEGKGEKEDAAPHWLDTEYNEEDLVANPHMAIGAVKRLRDELVSDFADVMRSRDEYWRQQLKERDPERLALRDSIAKLKEDPDYATLPDDALLVIAKKQRKPSEGVEHVSVPGGRRTRAKGGDADDLRKTALYQEIYGDKYVKKDGEK